MRARETSLRRERVEDVRRVANRRLDDPRYSWYEKCLLTYGAIQIISALEEEEETEDKDRGKIPF